MSNNSSCKGAAEASHSFAHGLLKAFDRHAEPLSSAFVHLSDCHHYVEFARQQFCGLEVPGVSPHPQFLQGWSLLVASLVDLLKDCQSVSTSQALDQRQTLVIEAFINSFLARLNREDDPQICWGAAVAYAQEQGQQMVAGSLRCMLTLTGVHLKAQGESGGIARTHGAGMPLVPEMPFQWASPIRCTPLGYYSLTTGSGFLQLLAPGFPECSRVTDFESVEGLLVELEIVRLLQREVCMLTEDWEFRNAVLAVGFTQARDILISAAASHLHAEAHETLKGINQNRDELAVWFCWALLEMERLLSGLYAQVEQVSVNKGEEHSCSFSSRGSRSVCVDDVRLELQALEASMLAAIQKLFLPASVSRHDYHPEVLWACSLWTQTRMERVPDDFASRLTGLALSWHMGCDAFEREALDLLICIENFPTLKWFMSFDASAALKAFCWSLPRNAHLVICCLYGEMLARKSTIKSGRLDTYWASVLVSVAQMPETFSALRVRRSDHRAQMAAFSASFQARFDQVFRQLSQCIPERTAEGDELLCIWNRSCLPLWEVSPKLEE